MSAKTFFGDARVTECPITTPVTVAPDTPLVKTIEKMRERGRGYAMVCEGSKFIGLFTERDFLNKIIGKGISPQTPIRELMRTNMVTLTKEATLTDAIEIMDRYKYRRLPLVDAEGNALGMITVFDIIHYLAEHFPAEVGNLPPHLHQKMVTQEGG